MLKFRTYLILTPSLKISEDVLMSKIYLNQMSPYRPLKKQVSLYTPILHIKQKTKLFVTHVSALIIMTFYQTCFVRRNLRAVMWRVPGLTQSSADPTNMYRTQRIHRPSTDIIRTRLIGWLTQILTRSQGRELTVCVPRVGLSFIQSSISC